MGNSVLLGISQMNWHVSVVSRCSAVDVWDRMLASSTHLLLLAAGRTWGKEGTKTPDKAPFHTIGARTLVCSLNTAHDRSLSPALSFPASSHFWARPRGKNSCHHAPLVWETLMGSIGLNSGARARPAR